MTVVALVYLPWLIAFLAAVLIAAYFVVRKTGKHLGKLKAHMCVDEGSLLVWIHKKAVQAMLITLAVLVPSIESYAWLAAKHQTISALSVIHWACCLGTIATCAVMWWWFNGLEYPVWHRRLHRWSLRTSFWGMIITGAALYANLVRP